MPPAHTARQEQIVPLQLQPRHWHVNNMVHLLRDMSPPCKQFASSPGSAQEECEPRFCFPWNPISSEISSLIPESSGQCECHCPCLWQQHKTRWAPKTVIVYSRTGDATCKETKTCDGSSVQLYHFFCDQTDCRGHELRRTAGWEEPKEVHLQGSCHCNHAWVSHVCAAVLRQVWQESRKGIAKVHDTHLL